MSNRDGARPRNVHFVDVSAHSDPERNAWLRARGDDARIGAAEYPVSALLPPEVPSHARPALSPRLESVRPPAGSRPPSQFPPGFSGTGSIIPPGLASVPAPPRPPSQFPAAPSHYRSPSQYPTSASASQYPGPDLGDGGLSSGVRERRRDTLIEDLVPRAEEEAVLAIKAAIDQFAEERAHALALAEKELVELVKVICRRVVLREVTLSSSVVEALVQEGLSALGRGDEVTVRLGPFFADALEHISDNLHNRGIRCTVTIDPAVGPHGCVLETELGRVDESVETRLNVLLASLDTVP
jgi:Flagellar assembly protein FliH